MIFGPEYVAVLMVLGLAAVGLLVLVGLLLAAVLAYVKS